MHMNIKSFIIDIDGVLYEGKKPVPGADKAIDYLQQKKNSFCSSYQYYDEKSARYGGKTQRKSQY